MYSPTTRLLSVIDLLRTHGAMSGPELAAALEIHVRSVRRYITMLQDLGIPIEIQRGRHGRYQLKSDVRPLTPALSNDELGALAVVMLLAERFGGVSAGSPSASSRPRLKLARHLPQSLREPMQVLDAAIVVQAPAPAVHAPGSVVVALGQAIQSRHRIEIDYQSHHGQHTQRQIDPFSLVQTMGAWYLVGNCQLRQSVRVFRLDRILSIRVMAETTFTPPVPFDALRYVEDSIARTPQRWHIQVLLHTSLEEAQRWMPKALAILEVQADGVLMKCDVDDLDRFAHFVAGLPCPCDIRQPAELHAALSRLATRIAALKRSTGFRQRHRRAALQ